MRIEDRFAQNEVLFNTKFQTINTNKDKGEQTESVSFGDVLKKTIDDTNNTMTNANLTTDKFIRGEDVNIDEVMIKNQEAGLSLQFLTQTRDKLVEGYKELTRLQL